MESLQIWQETALITSGLHAQNMVRMIESTGTFVVYSSVLLEQKNHNLYSRN